MELGAPKQVLGRIGPWEGEGMNVRELIDIDTGVGDRVLWSIGVFGKRWFFHGRTAGVGLGRLRRAFIICSDLEEKVRVLFGGGKGGEVFQGGRERGGELGFEASGRRERKGRRVLHGRAERVRGERTERILWSNWNWIRWHQQRVPGPLPPSEPHSLRYTR